MIPSRDTKETVYRTLHALCQRLPQDQASNCDLQVKMFLPKILQQTPGQLQPGDSCMAFGLCGAHKEEPLTLPHRATHEDTPSSALGSADRSQALFNPACALCLFVIKKLESLLPTNVTEDALIKLMGEVCDLLPESYKDQCDDFIAKYGTQIVGIPPIVCGAPHYLHAVACLLVRGAGGSRSVPPSSQCVIGSTSISHCQPSPDIAEPSLPSDCESCRTLAVLSRLNNGPNSTQPETSSFLQSVCVHYPNAIPKCEAFTKIYGPQLQKVFGNQMGSKHVCETAELCVPQQKVEPLGKERCTWGPSYWCKDVQTAQRCGNLAFCEKFMWKE
ncbi:hypothetical protein fugu_003858 [Takifugu bimaculatus]|uniref:Saposin B-type domain-containing protein n=1 Tax=Takifugu bimaculatus TaxID=433685 RepID=A0A4Z2BB40_9TELE|nr:hypothetical protein fugu_003858 [Takifugu bimaculatus]